MELLVWLLLLAVAVAGGALVLAQLGGAADDPRRRWARVAQRRAPARRVRQSPAGDLLEHIDRQVTLLLTERHRIQLLIQDGQRLRGKMQRSANHRARVPQLDRVVEHLRRRAGELDRLIARYYQQRDDLAVVVDSEDFGEKLAALDDRLAGRARADMEAVDTSSLDEECERLLDIAEAERELDVMLRAG